MLAIWSLGGISSRCPLSASARSRWSDSCSGARTVQARAPRRLLRRRPPRPRRGVYRPPPFDSGPARKASMRTISTGGRWRGGGPWGRRYGGFPTGDSWRSATHTGPRRVSRCDRAADDALRRERGPIPGVAKTRATLQASEQPHHRESSLRFYPKSAHRDQQSG